MIHRPDNSPERAAIIASQQTLLEKLNSAGVGRIVEGVLPGAKFPREVRLNDSLLRKIGWRVSALPNFVGPDKLSILAMSESPRIGEDQRATKSFHLTYSITGKLEVKGKLREYDEIIGDQLEKFERPLKEALERARENPHLQNFAEF